MPDNKSPQINFADCYVLSTKRTKDFIISFLQKFLPEAEEYMDTYQVPELAEQPSHTFNSVLGLIEHLETHATEQHAIYWSNKKANTLRGAMCLFMNDGQIIFGLVTETLSPNTALEDSLLQQLMAFCDSKQGLILYEEPAPRFTNAFLERIKPR